VRWFIAASVARAMQQMMNAVARIAVARVRKSAAPRADISPDGLLMTDDIDMKALSGTPAEKACGAIEAGVDLVLDCWARMDEMIAIANVLPDAGEKTLERVERALAFRKTPEPARFAELVKKRDELLALA
jgi:beta-N-acetylhexosaminidase